MPPQRARGGPGSARQASPRTLAIAGGVIVLVIVAVVLAVVLSNGGGGTNTSYDGPTIGVVPGTPAVGSSSSSNALLGASDVAKLLKGIPQKGFVLGQPNAPVTLVEYVDLQCPVCDQFETTEFPTLVQKYVRPGKLKIELKTWNILDAPDHTIDSLRGQKAVIAAAKQNLAFNFSEVLYDNQGVEGTNWLTDGMVSNIAASVDGLKTAQFVQDANSAATASLIKQIDNYANSRSQASPGPFSGTPTLLLGKGNQPPKFYGVGSPPMLLTNLEPAINKLLK